MASSGLSDGAGFFGNRKTTGGYSQESGNAVYTDEFWDDQSFIITEDTTTVGVATETFGSSSEFFADSAIDGTLGCEINSCTIMHFNNITTSSAGCSMNYTNDPNSTFDSTDSTNWVIRMNNPLDSSDLYTSKDGVIEINKIYSS